MRNAFLLLALGFLPAAAGGCSGIRTVDTGGVPTLTIAELDAGHAGESLRGVTEGHAAIIHFAPGDEVPVEFATHLPFATLEAGTNTMRFDHDVYLYIASDSFLVSPDMQRWAFIGDFSTIRELFGGGQGTFQLGFGAAEGQPATIHVTVGWQ